MRPEPHAAGPASQRLASLATLFDSTRNVAAALDGGTETEPAAGSPAARERAERHRQARSPGAGEVEAVDQHGCALVGLAAQHVWALGNMLEPRWPLEACRTLARTGVRASGCAWWLYDPDVGARERVCRGSALTTGPRTAPAGDIPAPSHAPPPGDTARCMLEAAPAWAVVAWRRGAAAALTDLYGPEPAGGARAAAGHVALATVALVVYVECLDRRLAYHGRRRPQWSRWRDHVARTVTRCGS